MADPAWRPAGAITLPAGTLLQYDNGSKTQLYFYDANHNGKLDEGDRKVYETQTGDQDFKLKGLRVSTDDVARYANEAGRLFAEARQAREALRGTIPEQKTGQCFVPVEGQGHDMAIVQGLEFRFQPSLTLRSIRGPREKLYSMLDLLQMDKKSPLADPARCLKAQAQIPRNAVSGRKLDPPVLTVGTGDLPIIPVLEYLGLKNGPDLDASYVLENGLEFIHLDLAR